MKALHSASGTGIGYNPGITYRGGEFLAQGIAQAGNAVAEGLAQFRKNREERDFLDQQRQTLAAELGKFKDFEKAANEDDSSPAGQFLKTFANWDNLSLAKQKAAVVDGQHYLAKREQEAQRTRAEQWHLLAEQRAEREFEEAKRHRGVMEGLGLRSADRADSAAILDWQRFGASQAEKQRQVDALDAFSDLFQKHQALQSSAPGIARPIDAEMLATWGAATKAMSPGEIARLSEIAARSQDPLAKFQAETERLRAEAYRQQTEATSPWARLMSTWAKPGLQGKPIVGAPGYVDIGGKPYKVEAAGPGADPQVAGRVAQLEQMLAQRGGQDFAYDYNDKDGYSTSRFWHKGESAKAELARLKGQMGGAQPAAPVSEVKRQTADGRTAIFDANTKKFLRYAD
jgi:hypothetical protein